MSLRPLPPKRIGGTGRDEKINRLIEEVKRLRPVPSVGTLTQATTDGVVREANPGGGQTSQDSLVWL